MNLWYGSILERHGKQVTIKRQGAEIAQLFASYENRHFEFCITSDVMPGDVIVNSNGNEFTVLEIHERVMDVEPYGITAYVQSEADKVSKSSVHNTIYNFGSMQGSSIGSHGYVTINYNNCLEDMRKRIEAENSPDKVELEQIANLLEMILNGQVPSQKGLFSKFSEVMERNSWISGAVASTIFSWLATAPF